jgi:hypothetical protein
MEEFVLIQAVATCHIEECENKDISIEVTKADTGIVQCGVCGIQIEDVVVADANN